mmetsp:Transcript_182846/g.579328  ORF Transcript_182846/g.579328 Transcript_182846/m.579328 type:complete len:201 (+) Transcript_182846:297-899(+)
MNCFRLLHFLHRLGRHILQHVSEIDRNTSDNPRCGAKSFLRDGRCICEQRARGAKQLVHSAAERQHQLDNHRAGHDDCGLCEMASHGQRLQPRKKRALGDPGGARACLPCRGQTACADSDAAKTDTLKQQRSAQGCDTGTDGCGNEAIVGHHDPVGLFVRPRPALGHGLVATAGGHDVNWLRAPNGVGGLDADAAVEAKE